MCDANHNGIDDGRENCVAITWNVNDVVNSIFSATASQQTIEAELQGIYPYLEIDYLTAAGQTVASAGHYGMYDFASILTAQRFLDRWQFPVDRMARFLADAGVVDQCSGRPISPDDLLEVLSYAAWWSRGNPCQHMIRLVDQLGMAHATPLDLTGGGLTPSTTYLDSVQAFLILHDFLIDITPSSSSNVRRPSDSFQSAARETGRTFTKVSTTKVGGLIGTAATIALTDALIAQGYIITLTPELNTTHLVHATEDNRVQYTANVTWNPPLESLAKISLYAKELWGNESSVPTPGPQQSQTVVWRFSGLRDRDGEWQTSNQPPLSLDTASLTDENGNAVIIFAPGTESRPNQGPETTQPGQLEAQLRFRSFFNPLKFLDIIPIGHANSSAFAKINVVRHVNLTLDITPSEAIGQWNYDGSNLVINYTFNNSQVPLTNAASGTLFEGTWTLNSNGTGTETIDGETCSVVTTSSFTDRVVASGMSQLSFSFSGTGHQTTNVICSDGGGESSGPMSGPSNIQFTLPAEEGASYTWQWFYPITGQIEFKLLEQ